MYQINFNKPEHIHFIGIGGISMSGLAEILLGAGFPISGSDAKPSTLTAHLEGMGAKVFYGQCAENISADYNCVVYTAAIHPDNPEFARCVELELPMLSRAELLGQIMKNYSTAIAVSGTHGKTTTTSMFSSVLLAADTDPTISVGGILEAIGGNIRVGKSETFITEACEYTNSFLSFYPTLSIILNIEEDHMDFFKDLDDIMNSFRLFAEKLPKNGTLIINQEIKDYEKITEGLACHVITYGMDPSCTYHAENVFFNEQGYGEFDVFHQDVNLGHIVLSVPGQHNVSNALSVIAAARKLGISMNCIREGLSGFRGANRRFQYKGTLNGVTIIDDYAHHPTEISVTLDSVKMRYPNRKVVALFKPHRASRVRYFAQEFADALSKADVVGVCDFTSIDDFDDGTDITIQYLTDRIEGCYVFHETDEEAMLLASMSPCVYVFMSSKDIYPFKEKVKRYQKS